MSTQELLKATAAELALPVADGRACETSRLESRLGRLLRTLLGTRARQGALTLADQAVVSGTNFLTTVILGRACLQHELGLYAMGFSLVVVLMGISRALIWMPYTTHSPHLEQDTVCPWGYCPGIGIHWSAQRASENSREGCDGNQRRDPL